MCEEFDEPLLQALSSRWCHCIQRGERPTALTARDGKHLRLVPRSERLDPASLRAAVHSVMSGSPHIVREARQYLPPAAGSPGDVQQHQQPKQCTRAALAWMRGLAYLTAGNARQALKDARFAMSYSEPRAPPPVGADDDSSDAIRTSACLWPAALEAAALALEALSQYQEAALLLQQALDLLVHRQGSSSPAAAAAADTPSPTTCSSSCTASTCPPGGAPAAAPGTPDNASCYDKDPIELSSVAFLSPTAPSGQVPASPQSSAARACASALERLRLHLSPLQLQALRAGGAAGLAACLEDERQESLPEIRRRRPKFYYYERWMSGRVREQLPGLPAPVVTAMVKKMDADDLDLILTHPAGAMAQASEMLQVLGEKGEAFLVEHYRPERLTWEEVQLLAGAGTVGLPLGLGEAGVQQELLGTGATDGSEGGRGLYRRLLTELACERYRAQVLPLLLEEGGGGASAGAGEELKDGSSKSGSGGSSRKVFLQAAAKAVASRMPAGLYARGE